MGYTEINVADKQVWKTVGDTEADGMKQWIKDFRAAMVNNYECYKKKGSDGKLDDPEFPAPFDAAATIEYPQCFWNIWSHEDLD